MRHSSRLIQILAGLVIVPTAAFAGGVPGRGAGIGSARGLSPVRPMVGSARGLSPIRPVVGAARALSPVRVDAGGRRGLAIGPIRHPFRERNIAAGYGDYGLAGAGLYGTGFGYAAGPYLPPVGSPGAEPEGGPQVLLAPPPPCVHPQIISVGRSVHVERQSTQHADVRVIYGRPPRCGTY